MKVYQLINHNGNAWANQFVIRFDDYNIDILQSYNSKVVMIDFSENHISFGDDWDYSKTTMKAVCKFLTDNIGDLENGKPWNAHNIRKALESGEAVDDYGTKWTLANACEDFFNDFFKNSNK